MESQSTGQYTRFHRFLEVTGIVTMTVFTVLLAWHLSSVLDRLSAWYIAGVGFVVAYIAADFISGIFHWLADRYGTADMPVLGPNVIRPFREHHIDPKGITRHDFIETNGNNSLILLPFCVGFFFLVPAVPGDGWSAFLLSFAMAFILGIFATNQFHKWAHEDKPPAIARLLQRWHLILPVGHHDIHHTSPYDTYYCITTGWLNWPLQKLRFFERIEWVILKLFGAKGGTYGPFPPGEDPLGLAPDVRD